jgi:hypothetical protein
MVGYQQTRVGWTPLVFEGRIFLVPREHHRRMTYRQIPESRARGNMGMAARSVGRVVVRGCYVPSAAGIGPELAQPESWNPARRSASRPLHTSGFPKLTARYGDGLLSFAAGVTSHATPELGSVTLGRATQPCPRCPCREMMDNIPGLSRCSSLQPPHRGLSVWPRMGRGRDWYWAMSGQCVGNVSVYLGEGAFPFPHPLLHHMSYP